MALKTKNNTYIKVNFSKSYIKGNEIFVSYTEYNSTEDREIDKKFSSQKQEFNKNFNLELLKYRQIFNSMCYSIKLNSFEISDVNFKLLLDTLEDEEYLELISVVETLLLLEGLYRKIYLVLFKQCKSIGINFSSFSTEEKEILNLNHFNQEWISSPVFIKGEFVKYVGKYTGGDITPTMYYNKLKSKLKNTVNC